MHKKIFVCIIFDIFAKLKAMRMRNKISEIIRFIAFVMFAAGAIMFIVGIVKGADAGKGYYTRDPAAQIAWYTCAAYSFSSLMASFLVYGFSFIVEAACKYLDRTSAEGEEKAEE